MKRKTIPQKRADAETRKALRRRILRVLRLSRIDVREGYSDLPIETARRVAALQRELDQT